MPRSSSLRRPADDLDLSGLADASLADLRVRWKELYGTEAPRCFRRTLLARAVGHRLQVLRYGDVPAPIARTLERIAAASRAARSEGRPARPVSVPARLVPGARLLRTWREETHEVEVLEGGFRWRGRTFRSLSAIAREITGARWNGPAFFGLRRP